ncbi:serine protease 33 [Amia ocellicauda]|uniref:serine protease 33 n=1 Tax=Amia ocellicauda TaxID=2972642 RepID=UPI003463A21A
MLFLQLLFLVLALNTYEVSSISGNGVETNTDWNWVVGIKVGSHVYPGVLVRENWVLTSKHIFDGVAMDSVSVSPFNPHLPKGKGVRVINFSDHRYDLALLQLESELNVVPIILPKTAMPDAKAATMCHVGSWNAKQPGLSWRAVSARVRLVDNKRCNTFKPDQHTFCASANVTDTTFCQGDSGGPLYCEVNKEWVLFGVASRGVCNNPSIPTIFSSVYDQLKWLDCQTEKND